MKTPDSHIYVGRLEEACSQSVYAVGSETVERIEPTGDALGWGADADGAGLILARLLLNDASGTEPSADLCLRFEEQVISRLPYDGFVIPRVIVNAWLRRVVTV